MHKDSRFGGAAALQRGRLGIQGPETQVARKLKSDKVLFVATILLVCVSVVMVYSASAMLALERFQEPYRFLMRQALWAAMGIGVLAIAMRIDYRTYRNEALIWAVLALVALMLV